MDIQAVFHAIILGVVQGFTEFLPISSSGHLVLVNEVLGLPYYGKAFDLTLHLGSLFAVLYFFRAELGGAFRGAVSFLLSGLRRWPEKVEERLGVIAMITTVPTAAAGFLLDPLVEPFLQGRVLLALMLGLFGLVMAGVDRWTSQREAASADGLPLLGVEQMGWKQSLFMGCAQALAFIPGVSRSGVSLTMARFLGLSRAQAVRLSMFMSVPVIAGAISVKVASGAIFHVGVPFEAVWVGVAVAAICSWLSLRLLTHMGNILQGCAAYRVVLALILLATSFS